MSSNRTASDSSKCRVRSGGDHGNRRLRYVALTAIVVGCAGSEASNIPDGLTGYGFPGAGGSGQTIPPPPATCGNGVLDPGEQCEGMTTATCASLTMGAATMGTVACTNCYIDGRGCYAPGQMGGGGAPPVGGGGFGGGFEQGGAPPSGNAGFPPVGNGGVTPIRTGGGAPHWKGGRPPQGGRGPGVVDPGGGPGNLPAGGNRPNLLHGG